MRYFVFLALYLEAACSLPSFLEKQIQEDMYGHAPFGQVEIEESWQRAKDLPLFFRCKMLEGKTYIQAAEETKNNARYWVVRNALEELARKRQLHFLDAIFCLQDRFDGLEGRVPIFAFSARKGAPNAALMPDCEALNPIDRRYLISSMKQASRAHPWDSKRETVFWRGTPTGLDETERIVSKSWKNPRHKLVQMSLDEPNLANAEFTHTYRASDYGVNPPPSSPGYWENILPVSQPVHPEDHLEYRYLIDLDGHSTCFSRTFWILLSNSVLFKQITENRQWFYQGLKPYVHFVPVAEDLSDLKEIYAWCRLHEKECLQISMESSRFALEQLGYEQNLDYLSQLLQAYESLSLEKPKLTKKDQRDWSCRLKYGWYKLKRHVKKWTSLPVASRWRFYAKKDRADFSRGN